MRTKTVKINKQFVEDNIKKKIGVKNSGNLNKRIIKTSNDKTKLDKNQTQKKKKKRNFIFSHSSNK